MSDHVTMLHGGRVTLSGALDDVRRSYQRSRVRFVEHFDQPPVLEAALAMEGGGRTWIGILIPLSFHTPCAFDPRISSVYFPGGRLE